MEALGTIPGSGAELADDTVGKPHPLFRAPGRRGRVALYEL
jgi:hypothetical protein